MTLRGIALYQLGYYSDALSAFELSVGSNQYESIGIQHHADLLRWFGPPYQAAQLRRTALYDQRLPANRKIALWMGIIDDFRVAKDYEKAINTADVRQ